jgi:HSP20 family protein
MSDDFDDLFPDVDDYFKKLTKKMFKEMEDIEEALRSGKLQGEWGIKPIEEPGTKGYIAKGRFHLGGETEKQVPKTFKLPDQIEEEVREPLTDVFQDKDNVKIYIELPGVDKNDIQLNVTDGHAEIKAKNFFKTIELPSGDVVAGKAVANYRNGVLEVTIPKLKKATKPEAKHAIKIE